METMINECRRCVHKRNVPGNCHIACTNPDPLMTGNEHGIRNGWFVYPLLFDPTWKTKKCINFSADQKDQIQTEESSDLGLLLALLGVRL